MLYVGLARMRRIAGATGSVQAVEVGLYAG